MFNYPEHRCSTHIPQVYHEGPRNQYTRRQRISTRKQEQQGTRTRKSRVWKACERCRAKKTKCNGESPCQKCKHDGSVCTLGKRKMLGYKAFSRGYAEVLENNQVALTASVLKLYTMVCGGQSWTFGEPGRNDQGQPIIHEIVEKLGCTKLAYDSASDPEPLLADEDEIGTNELPDTQADEDSAIHSSENISLTDNNEFQSQPSSLAGSDIRSSRTNPKIDSMTTQREFASTCSTSCHTEMTSILDPSYLFGSEVSPTSVHLDEANESLGSKIFGELPTMTSDQFFQTTRGEFHDLFCGSFSESGISEQTQSVDAGLFSFQPL